MPNKWSVAEVGFRPIDELHYGNITIPSDQRISDNTVEFGTVEKHVPHSYVRIPFDAILRVVESEYGTGNAQSPIPSQIDVVSGRCDRTHIDRRYLHGEVKTDGWSDVESTMFPKLGGEEVRH